MRQNVVISTRCKKDSFSICESHEKYMKILNCFLTVMSHWSSVDMYNHLSKLSLSICVTKKIAFMYDLNTCRAEYNII